MTSLQPDPEEWRDIDAALSKLKDDPLLGERVFYPEYPGGHRLIEVGRFLFIYQFSDREIRIKDIVESELYDD